MTSTTDTTTRAEYTAGLRALADLLDDNPEQPLPYAAGTSGSMASYRVTFYSLLGEDPRGDLARFARLIPGKVTKEIDDTTFRVVGRLRGLHLEAVAYRSAVCERVVTGSSQVTREIPAVEATPAQTVTETVEDVEWVCEPILAAVTS